jgi:chromosomal replication initiation ATPase DnaA
MPTPPQLPLPFLRPPTRPSGDFLRAPSNEAALTWLARTADWPQGRLALWGEPGCGKTHLLSDWAATTGAHLLHGPALPELGDLPDLPSARGLAIDEADALTREPTLLHLLNAAAEARQPVLLAARTPPARWPIRLPDLASRLRAITAVEIGPPEDTLLRALLARLFADRGQRVQVSVQDWLLSHLPRTPATLREAVDRLDRAALARPGGITQPFARAVLQDLLNLPSTDSEPASAADLDEDSMSSVPGSP